MIPGKERRRPQLEQWLAEADLAESREEAIAGYVVAKSVLDVGVVDSRREAEPTSSRLNRFATGLHEHIRQLNPSVVGVDLDAEGVELLQAGGYDVVCADVETMDLGRRFDVIVAGEIIEHLPNPGRSLENLRKHLMPSGRLILTTCNPFCLKQLWKIWRYGVVQVHEEHTTWFDPRTLGRLLHLAGYEVERLCWISRRRHGFLRRWSGRWRQYFNSTFLLVARPG
jgi:SAM-dependent methyltransferase